MSSVALMWAAGIAPVADVQEYACLTRMADEADEAGCGVYLATATIADDIKCSEKTVQRRLDAMLERKLIGLGDQRLAQHIRADRRPVVYDLLIPAKVFGDLERTNKRRADKGLPPITPENRPEQAPPSADDMRSKRNDTGKPRRKIYENGSRVDETAADGVTTSPPVHGVTDSPAVTGGLVVQHGVTSSPERGDYQSPNPGVDPGVDPELQNPPPPSPPENAEVMPAPGDQEEEAEISEGPTNQEIADLLLADLFRRLNVSEERRPNPGRHAKLTALAADRLTAGWPADALRRAISEPLVGVDSVFAVMQHRLRELPATPPQSVLARSAPSQRARSPRCGKGAAHAAYFAGQCPICAVEAEDKAAQNAAAAQNQAVPAEITTDTVKSGLEAARAAAAAASSRPVVVSRWQAAENGMQFMTANGGR